MWSGKFDFPWIRQTLFPAVDPSRKRKLIMKAGYKSEWLQMHRSLAWCNNKDDLDR